MANIFNGSPQVGGVFEAFSDDKVMITIARAGATADLDAGFLASGYRLNFQRNVSPRRFLNDTAAYYTVGFGVGTLQLDGLVGSKEAFDNLVSDENADICTPLTITVYPSFFKKCADGKSVKTGTEGSLAYVCGNCIASNINLNGQVDQQGVVMNTGTLVFQIGSLQTTNGAATGGSNPPGSKAGMKDTQETAEAEA